MASVTSDVETLLAPYRDSSTRFFAGLSARAVAFQLSPIEQEETVQVWQQMVDQLVDRREACDRQFWQGARDSALTTQLLETLPRAPA